MNNIPILTFVGRSGSGKTTFLEKLIRELTGRGYRLATVKHHSHSSFEIDCPGKDSWRFAQAGSRHVVVAAPEKIASYRLLEHDLPLDEVVADIKDVDLILVEGYKQSGRDCIQVIRKEVSTDLVGDLQTTIAIVGNVPLDVPVPQLGLDDITQAADLVEDWLAKQKGS